MGFAGVYRAVYAYSAASDGELSLSEGDLLYLLEKADDGWWTVKKRVPGAASEEPKGIVPHNYIEPAPPTGQAAALYSYEKQTDEELSFAEGAEFDVFATDGDWVLVGARRTPEFGFVPSNYVEARSGAAAAAAPVAAAAAAPAAAPAPAAAVPAAPVVSQQSAAAYADAPPPKPQRPQRTGEPLSDGEDGPPRPSRPGRRPTREQQSRDLPDEPRAAAQDVKWPVIELNGRRKIPKTLVVAPQYVTLINDDGGGHTQKWDVHNILSYSSEKKHVFLEFHHPRASLDLKVTSQQLADGIVAALGQVVGAGRGGGLQEVLAAAQSAGHKSGTILLDFKAANSKELTVSEDDAVFIVNDSDKDWWVVRSVTGKEGLVPRKFVQVEEDSSKFAALFKGRPNRGKAKEAAREKGRSLDRQPSRRADAERHERAELRRERSRRDSARNQPDSRKLRTWVDRSGSFRVDAVLLGCSDGKVHMHKANGVKIAVPASKLSIEDIEYVESVTGVNLNDDKPLSERRSKRQSPKASRSSAAEAQETQIARDDKWLTFFLECGIEPHNANRYARNFTRDNMDDTVLSEITASNLRTLGLREGDILRVMRKLNEKFGRNQQAPEGGLYSDGGVLRNNTSKTPAGVDEKAWAEQQASASAPTSAPASAPGSAQASSATSPVPQPQAGQPPTGALADLLGVSPQSTQQQAAALQAQQTAAALQAQQTAAALAQQTAALQAQQTAQQNAQLQALQAQKTATLQAQKTAEDKLAAQQRATQQNILRQQAELQQEQIRLLKQQQEQLRKQQDDLITIQKTGSQLQALGPFATGVAQLSAFAPSAASVLAAPPPPQPRGFQQPLAVLQPTGFQALQPTGGFQQQATGPFGNQVTGGGLGALGGQRTGPFAQPLQQSQPTGPFAQPLQQPLQQSQPTGPFAQPLQQSQATGPFAQPLQQSQPTGPFQQPLQPVQLQQRTGPFGQVPQQSQPTGPFAQPLLQQSQPTGPFAQPLQQTQATGPFAQLQGAQRTGPFGSQATGSFAAAQPLVQPQQAPSTGYPAAGLASLFGGAAQPSPFQSQAGLQSAQRTGQFQTAQSTFQTAQATGPFGQAPQAQPAFGQQAQPAFGQQTQPAFGQQAQPAFGQQTQPAFGQQPFGQQFAQAPLQQQAQATGPFQQQAPPAFGAQPPATNFGGQGVFAPPQAQAQPAQTFAQPLQNQATGFGFGNQPQQQPQQAPGRANFAMATASNPFGL